MENYDKRMLPHCYAKNCDEKNYAEVCKKCGFKKSCQQEKRKR